MFNSTRKLGALVGVPSLSIASGARPRRQSSKLRLVGVPSSSVAAGSRPRRRLALFKAAKLAALVGVVMLLSVVSGSRPRRRLASPAELRRRAVITRLDEGNTRRRLAGSELPLSEVPSKVPSIARRRRLASEYTNQEVEGLLRRLPGLSSVTSRRRLASRRRRLVEWNELSADGKTNVCMECNASNQQLCKRCGGTNEVNTFYYNTETKEKQWNKPELEDGDVINAYVATSLDAQHASTPPPVPVAAEERKPKTGLQKFLEQKENDGEEKLTPPPLLSATSLDAQNPVELDTAEAEARLAAQEQKEKEEAARIAAEAEAARIATAEAEAARIAAEAEAAEAADKKEIEEACAALRHFLNNKKEEEKEEVADGSVSSNKPKKKTQTKKKQKSNV